MKNIKALIESGKSAEDILNEASGNKEAYNKFFNEKLAKFKVKHIGELDDSKKKEFFAEIEKEWTGDTNSVNEAKFQVFSNAFNRGPKLSKEALDRMDGLHSSKDESSLKSSVNNIIKDLVDEGFDTLEAQQFILFLLNLA